VAQYHHRAFLEVPDHHHGDAVTDDTLAQLYQQAALIGSIAPVLSAVAEPLAAVPGEGCLRMMANFNELLKLPMNTTAYNNSNFDIVVCGSVWMHTQP
jgi:hypothetical protein